MSRRYHPTAGELAAQEAEWRERSAVEDPANVEAQWLRTFAAADAREHPARLRYALGDWSHQ